jgi:hypothetical protein
MRAIPTAPIAAASLIVGYAVVLATGSRPLGGVVLAVGGLWCIYVWAVRHGARTAMTLGCVGLGLFIASHLLALVVGAWPSVLVVAGAMGMVAWVRADSLSPMQAGASRALRFRS